MSVPILSEALKAVRQARGEGTSERMGGRPSCPPPPQSTVSVYEFPSGKDREAMSDTSILALSPNLAIWDGSPHSLAAGRDLSEIWLW